MNINPNETPSGNHDVSGNDNSPAHNMNLVYMPGNQVLYVPIQCSQKEKEMITIWGRSHTTWTKFLAPMWVLDIPPLRSIGNGGVIFMQQNMAQVINETLSSNSIHINTLRPTILIWPLSFLIYNIFNL